MSSRWFRSVVASPWTRREWLTTNAAALAASRARSEGWLLRGAPVNSTQERLRSAHGSALIDASAWEELAQRGVEAATAAGASYADVRLTRIVQHMYSFALPRGNYLGGDMEVNGAGVRVLVNGYWGFSASPRIGADNIAQLARDAVAQAKVNALGSSRATILASTTTARGSWATPMKIDPFTISIEEKNDYITSWIDYSIRIGVPIDTIQSGLRFARQERTVATSDGSLFTQRLYESGGAIICTVQPGPVSVAVDGLQPAGKGWELVLDADIPEQLRGMQPRLEAKRALSHAARPAVIGRYTVVCDGETMASLLDQTVGLATQLDRALGYEANASGTSYLDDPLDMIGNFQVASPLVTISANRSAPQQLATVKWDDEGVAPQEATLVKNGVLNDFQTTREQASWLSSYYERHGRAVVSHGYAGSESALAISMQLAPNLAMAPAAGNVTVDDLVATVSSGILVTSGVTTTDMQARNGMITGSLRKITNGRLGPQLKGGAVLFNTLDLWRQVNAIGGVRTVGMNTSSQYPFGSLISLYGYTPNIKGQPPQITSHSVTAPAASITGLPIIDPTRKA